MARNFSSRFLNFSKDLEFSENLSQPLKREPCQLEEVTLDDLAKLGVECLSFDADNYENDQTYAKFKSDRGYNYQDIITVSRNTIPDYDTKVASFLREHIHDDEETR